MALEQIAAFPSAKFRENVKLDQQTSRSDTGEGLGTAAAIDLFGVGIVVGDVGLRFIGVAEDAVMWHSLPAELVLDLFSNPYEWDVVAKKVTRPTRLLIIMSPYLLKTFWGTPNEIKKITQIIYDN